MFAELRQNISARQLPEVEDLADRQPAHRRRVVRVLPNVREREPLAAEVHAGEDRRPVGVEPRLVVEQVAGEKLGRGGTAGGDGLQALVDQVEERLDRGKRYAGKSPFLISLF